MNNHKTRLDERSTKQIFYADQTSFFKINYNGATTSSDGTQATFTSSGRVNFLVDFEQFHKYSQIKSIKIRVKATGITSFRINQEQSLYTKIDTSTEYYSADGNGYCEMEVVNNCGKEQLYRNALADRKIDTSNIGGFIGDDTFKYLLEDQQLRDNAEYRKMYYDMQAQNQKDMMEFRKWQAEKEAEQNKIDNYYKGQQIAQGWKKLEQDAMGNVDTEALKEIDSAEAIIAQLEEAHSKLPQYAYPKGTQKIGAILTGASSQLGLDTNTMSAYKAISKGTVSPLLRKLGEKGALSDGDVKRGEQLQPSPYDTPEQAAAKIAELRALFEKAKLALMGGSFTGTPKAQTGNTTKSGVKYEVID